MPELFPQVDASPYPWPFDGQWNAVDTALLLLGFQNNAVDALCAQKEVATAARLLAAASACGMLMIASRKGQDVMALAALNRRTSQADISLTPNTNGWQLSAELGLSSTAPIVDHAGDNAFYNTGLEALLRRRGIRNLLVCGLPTDGLVHATQRNANDMGFECLAVFDACKGTSAERHTGQLRIMTFGNGLFGAVASCKPVLESISQE
ncbi:cysteine hydrolase family protein [Roseibium algae]|uniref:Isochorismatase family cysteine hydrolase n=1 Tax=Roseibium algae TaxID=3123038 RepID=A0ABU8TJ14_9HYPH